MGKKKKTELGRALIKDRFSSRGKRNDSMLHTSELNDGYDWGRLNLQSVTEESSFDEFLRTAELAGTEFQAEKLNIAFVNAQTAPGVLTLAERENFQKTKKEKSELLRIPRRPKWNSNTTGDELQAKERENFLEWRRGLATLQEEQGLVLTPYEKNLDFWRQLWRVVERSDVVVQILDARNPLLFRCEDLEKYSNEVSKDKMNFLLLNKADYLTEKQRTYWAKYFESIGVRCAFFSALKDLETLEEEEEPEEKNKIIENEQSNADEKEVYNDQVTETTDIQEEHDISENDKPVEDINTPTETSHVTSVLDEPKDEGLNSSKLLSREELIELFESLLPASSNRVTQGQATIGLVGYPNVGKSSTINSLMGVKKVSVSATPGKTKHFQTLYIEGSTIMLCDCPGLVFPSLVATKADMLLSGILPIDQMRDYTEAVATLRTLVPDHVFQQIYGIMIPEQPPGVHEHAPHTLLSSYAYCRGFMTANGCPDMSRAARLILKDFVNGKVLYCTAPPDTDQASYHPFPEPTKKPPQLTAIASRAIADRKTVTVKDLDKNFFNKASLGAHSKGPIMAGAVSQQSNPKSSTSSDTQPSKPWKDHSHKRNKKEKLRRLYRHLDE